MLKTACYIRVSTEEQIENYSIDAQKDRLTNFCKAKDWLISKFYIDPAFSGSNLNRPALKQLISDINSNKVDMVLVYKLDRLSRSQKDTLYLIEDIFLKNNVEFVSMSENFDTSTPFGRAMLGILSVFAQLEREQIKERMTMGRVERAKEGYFHGGASAPIGYDYIDSKLIINEYEANQVKLIFNMFTKGYTLNHISKFMHENYHHKYGNWASVRTVSNVIKNSIYISKVKFNNKEYEGIHESIVDEKIYKLANERLNSNERTLKLTQAQKRPFKYKEILSGLLYCGKCGARYACNHGNYSCYSRSKSSKKFINDPDCKNDNWNIEELNQIVINEIIKVSLNIKSCKISSRDDASENDKSIKGIDKELLKVESQINKVLDLYQLGNLDISIVSERIEKLQNEKANLEEMLDAARSKTNELNINVEEIEQILKNAKTVLENSSIPEKRMFISMLIEKIILNGKDVEFVWVFDFVTNL